MINYDQLAELTAKAHGLLDEVERILDVVQSELQTAKAAEEAQPEPAPAVQEYRTGEYHGVTVVQPFWRTYTNRDGVRVRTRVQSHERRCDWRPTSRSRLI